MTHEEKDPTLSITDAQVDKEHQNKKRDRWPYNK